MNQELLMKHTGSREEEPLQPEELDSELEEVLSHSENCASLGIFQFPLINQEECEHFAEMILKERYSTPENSGTMQKHTVDVTTLMNTFLLEHLEKKVVPKINMLFNYGEKKEYYIFSAHTVIYALENGETKLNIHSDDADITVNITLRSEDLEGCSIKFHGLADFGNTTCDQLFGGLRKKLSTLTSSTHDVVPNRGFCLLHRGSHVHETNRLIRGSRLALIIWLKEKR